MSDLELEKLELEKLELELELKKREIELKKQELMQQEEREKVEVIEETVVEESKINIETVGWDVKVEETGLKIKREEKKQNKDLQIGLIAIFLSILILGSIYFVKRQEYYESIPLIIENPEQYYNMTYKDIIEMYGEPDEKGNYIYDMGDYELFFDFKHGFVSWILYEPYEEYFTFRKPTDVLYFFGIGDKASLYENNGNVSGLYRCTDYSYPIDAFGFHEENLKSKTTKGAIIYFKEHYPDRKVFEGDFTNTPVIYNLVQYMGMNRNNIINTLGKSEIVKDKGTVQVKNNETWIYETDLGRIELYFAYHDKVELIDFYANEPIKYETSTQEAMVMFGVDPTLTGLRLDEYFGSSVDYFESYDNFKRLIEDFWIDGINLENKTFESITIRMK